MKKYWVALLLAIVATQAVASEKEYTYRRCDESATLQNCDKYRGALRVNGMYYTAKQGKQTGGVADIRSHDKEAQQYYALLNKWGSKIVRRDRNDRSHSTNKTKVNQDYNPIIKIPIKGV